MKTKSLKNRLMSFVIFTILSMILIEAFTVLISKKIEITYSVMIKKMLLVNEISNDIDSSLFYFDKYIDTKALSDFNQYEINYKNAKGKILLLRDNTSEEIIYILRDLENTLDNYKQHGDSSITKYKRLNKDEEFYKEFIETKNIGSYCKTYIEKLNSSFLNYNSQLYKNIVKNNSIVYGSLITFIVIIIGFCILYSVSFSRKLAKSLDSLVKKSKQVSKGNFKDSSIIETEIYEIDVLAKGFNSMTSAINKLIESIKRKAEVERQLKDQQMKNLQIENLLKHTQIKMLQSQINPHFLFNTLNSIVQISIIEGAYETEKLIKSISELLRYNLRNIDRYVSLQDELDVVKNYVFIQETRFEDRVKFKIEVNGNIEDIKVPSMTIQPIVENAFIHGIEPKEDGGEIFIKIERLKDICIILIEDNGCGIDEETLRKINSISNETKYSGHATGIGVGNVVKRLQLLYHSNDILQIESKVNIGTKVFLKIPVKGSAVNYDKNINCG
ncbi:sensor histidine kinase [Clostridium magnum]|uniref:histidine kinase n=1 Tax=Clostridium magnum DSM 2767 TaxID=1121326 RepID=A0A161WF47_9CLOT|nr:sensor histidine kinase [Clostridium magnum]KZL90265.1 sensor histidine kinase YehU [Clostridium magnum DSM 2767]SHH80491.1 HAMP domain-containing protein [Clostridium magnum DSM 2767]